MVKKDPNLTTAQLITTIKSTTCNAEMPNRKEIESIVTLERENLTPLIGGPGLFDLQKIKTMRNTTFGRGISFCMIDNKPWNFIYMYSDWEAEMAKEAMEQPYPHLLIDGTFKCCPKQWQQVLNFAVFNWKRNLYVPIGHVLMQT